MTARYRVIVGVLAANLIAVGALRAQPLSRASALSSRHIAASGLAGQPADTATEVLTEVLPVSAAGPTLTDVQRLATIWQEAKPKSRKDAAPWWAPVASAIIPGTGQIAMGQQRGVAYMVAEGYLLVQAFTARRDWQIRRDEYIAIAADVARRQFGGTLPVGSWEYYEAMQGFLEREGIESGIFDIVQGGAVDPETNEATYNGGRWRIARETYWADPNSSPAPSSPEYQLALADYERTAIRDEFRWSWRDAINIREIYRQTIASSNRSNKRSVNMVGLVGMNHLVSLIDAYVTTRIRRYGGVRAVGLKLEGIESGVRAVGDPALARYQVTSGLRFVPIAR